MNDFERGILGAATGTNGSIILVGYMYGNWSAPDLSGIRKDCLAIKLNAEGQMVWKMQVMKTNMRTWGRGQNHEFQYVPYLWCSKVRL